MLPASESSRLRQFLGILGLRLGQSPAYDDFSCGIGLGEKQKRLTVRKSLRCHTSEGISLDDRDNYNSVVGRSVSVPYRTPHGTRCHRRPGLRGPAVGRDLCLGRLSRPGLRH